MTIPSTSRKRLGIDEIPETGLSPSMSGRQETETCAPAREEQREDSPRRSPALEALVRRLLLASDGERAATASINAVIAGVARAVELGSLAASSTILASRAGTSAIDVFAAREGGLAVDSESAASDALGRHIGPMPRTDRPENKDSKE